MSKSTVSSLSGLSKLMLELESEAYAHHAVSPFYSPNGGVRKI